MFKTVCVTRSHIHDLWLRYRTGLLRTLPLHTRFHAAIAFSWTHTSCLFCYLICVCCGLLFVGCRTRDLAVLSLLLRIVCAAAAIWITILHPGSITLVAPGVHILRFTYLMACHGLLLFATRVEHHAYVSLRLRYLARLVCCLRALDIVWIVYLVYAYLFAIPPLYARRAPPNPRFCMTLSTFGLYATRA